MAAKQNKSQETARFPPYIQLAGKRFPVATMSSLFLRKERLVLISLIVVCGIIVFLNHGSTTKDDHIATHEISKDSFGLAELPKRVFPQLGLSWATDEDEIDPNGPFKDYLTKTVLVTAKGNAVTYQQINDEVFKPYGFEIEKATIPIPTLKNTRPQTCDQIFADWLTIAQAYKPPSEPPKELTPDLMNKFTLNGHSVITMAYYNNMAIPAPKVWDQIPQWINKDPMTFSNYGEPGLSVKHSMKYMNVAGLHGCVIGSEQPWVEVISLQNGVASLVTVEYQNTTILGTDKIKYIHPYDYAKTWKDQTKFDFCVSFSSIEHSGLQRYGDPQDPIGDIRELQKVRCMLKKGGIFFLGLPRGQDQLVYNAHRVYGRIRLAMMFDGFELLHVFRDNNSNPQLLAVSDFPITGGPTQDTFVLRKL